MGLRVEALGEIGLQGLGLGFELQGSRFSGLRFPDASCEVACSAVQSTEWLASLSNPSQPPTRKFAFRRTFTGRKGNGAGPDEGSRDECP